ncbi:hypothetical protein BD413DRAFT_476477 [Trametes elegans]|nr:hypothetical protein BD413DRAFT_476477 [Trametes elegans]
MDLHDVAHRQQQQYASTAAGGHRRSRASGVNGGPPIPGTWGFLTSGYFVGLFIMAFVLNRIQNIVVPPRRTHGVRLHTNHFAMNFGHQRLSWRQLVWARFFPVNFASTFSKLLFRVPSLYFLAKAVTLWTVLLLKTQRPVAFAEGSWLEPLGAWTAAMKMEDVCWYTFMAACLALCIGTLTTGLEGINMNEASPFNLFAFAFHLYVCAASHPAPQKEGEDPSRPDIHVILTILLPLLQLTVMHCLEMKRHWSKHRLAVSSTIGIIALAHFHLVVWRSPTAYPLTTYAARVIESIMLGVIAFTVALNAISQVLVDGAITRPLLGHAAILPHADEDFNVALFRLGTASMDATAVAGLGNEVGGVAHGPPAPPPAGTKADVVSGALELDRGGVAALSPAYARGRDGARAVRKGFANEIVSVKARAAGASVWMDTVLNVAWQRQLGAFLLSAWRAACRVWALVYAWVRGRAEVEERARSLSAVLLDGPPSRSEEVEGDAYERFLRGEPVSDDDEEFEPGEDERRLRRSPTPVSDGEEDEGEEDGADEEGEQAQLYADLSTSASDIASAPLLLAHMTADPASSPLTRRMYGRLVSGSHVRATGVDGGNDEWEEWEGFVRNRRHTKRAEAEARGEDPFAEQTRNCVICTVEPRDVICWPCRCLALCDDCRENLASRSSASKHTCPCCRQSVEGYSKIYIP